VVTEAMSEGDVSAVAEYADLVQIGSRNMQNFALLKAVGRAGVPVLLKRAMSATVEEWLLAGSTSCRTARPG
jgi:3-deoxy-D-arabino-heptulosonate 7-phosphate (DAHP) synthase